MGVFYLTLAVTFSLSLLARKTPEKSHKPNLPLTLIIMAIFILVAGLRSNIGDTGAYKQLYRLVGAGEIVKGSYETGFVLFLAFLNQISGDPQLMIFATALITNALIIWTLRNYASLFELETFMYITSGYYLVTMNGIRQALVAALLFAATKLIIEGKFKIYLLITIVLYYFHTSALIMIPAYFIVRQETWSKQTVLVFISLPIILIFFQPLMSVMFATMEGTRYASYEQAIMTGGEGGANIIRVLVTAVPVLIAYLERHNLRRSWAASNIFVNMSVINLIVMIFSLNNWLFARFTFYFQPYNFILLPYLLKTTKFKERQLIYCLFVVLYFVFFYYEQVISMHIQYKSNFF